MNKFKNLPTPSFVGPRRPESDTLPVPTKKKRFGQHFLRKQSVVDNMINAVTISSVTPVLEIGCGDGFLTRSILAQTKCKSLACVEIDEDWARVVQDGIRDPRLSITIQNILEFDLEMLKSDQPIVLLANLPYQITFPIIFKLKDHRHLFSEGVIMVQEEVAHKLTALEGRGYSATTLLLQRYFTWKLLDKVEPGAFTPPPKVFSRLVYFAPRYDAPAIQDEEAFWKFIKKCFTSPRQTMRNNLKGTHYSIDKLDEATKGLRAQQLTFEQFYAIWLQLNQQ